MDQWGTMLTGWVYVDGHYYYMDQWGTMLTGWVYVDGRLLHGSVGSNENWLGAGRQ